jgi:hypothetical protein
MISPRQKPRGKSSTNRSLANAEGWSRARRDLATPQGSSLMSALLLCFACIIVAIVLCSDRVLGLPEPIVYPVAIAANIVIIILAVIRISAMNKRADEARREAYRQKFEKNLEAVKEWSERRNSGITGKE